MVIIESTFLDISGSLIKYFNIFTNIESTKTAIVSTHTSGKLSV